MAARTEPGPERGLVDAHSGACGGRGGVRLGAGGDFAELAQTIAAPLRGKARGRPMGGRLVTAALMRFMAQATPRVALFAPLQGVRRGGGAAAARDWSPRTTVQLRGDRFGPERPFRPANQTDEPGRGNNPSWSATRRHARADRTAHRSSDQELQKHLRNQGSRMRTVRGPPPCPPRPTTGRRVARRPPSSRSRPAPQHPSTDHRPDRP